MLERTVYDAVTVLDLLVVLTMFIVIAIIAKVLEVNIRRRLKDRARRDQVEMVTRAVYIIVFLIAVVAALPILGVNPTGLLVAGGFAAIVIGFASQSIVSNLISGIFLMFERPMKIGDMVEVDNITGVVDDIRTISTTIRKFDGLYVRIPNERVFTSNIINYESNVALRVEYQVGIRYSDDAQKAAEIINALMEEHPMVLVRPPRQIFVDELGDNSVNLKVRFWAPTANFEWWRLKMELLWKVKKELEANGIKVPFPQREVWFNSELALEQKEPGGPAG